MLSDFQKRFLLGAGAQQTLYTEKEFTEAVAQAKAEIMAIAIETSKQAVGIERQACADLAREAGHPDLAEKILNRLRRNHVETMPGTETDQGS